MNVNEHRDESIKHHLMNGRVMNWVSHKVYILDYQQQ